MATTCAAIAAVAGLGYRPRSVFDLLADRMDRTVEILHFQPQDDVRIRDRRTSAHRLIQRMTAREIHALA